MAIGETILKRLLLIGDLSREDQRAVLGIRGELRDLRRGEDIIREGDRPTGSVICLRGLLKRYKIGPDGKRQIHAFYLPTDAPCLETITLEVVHDNLGAIVPSQIGIIEHAELTRVMDAHPKVRMLIWRDTLVQGVIFREWLMRNSQMAAPARLAHFFCELLTRAKAAGIAEGNACELPLTQEDLGDALGMTPVHINRTLMGLRDGGRVEFQKGRLTITDWPGIAAVAEFDPRYLHFHHLRKNGAD